jgi:heme-degrading monooxygenase HmoA
MIALLWTYRVKPECQALFEAIYSPQGDWAKLFRQASGFGGTELLRQAGGRYATIDRWSHAADFERFKEQFRAAYDALDKRCEALTLEEQFLGRFEVCAGESKIGSV